MNAGLRHQRAIVELFSRLPRICFGRRTNTNCLWLGHGLFFLWVLAGVPASVSAQMDDLDRDGIADRQDSDQDNDGIPNRAEGYTSIDRAALPPADNFSSAAIAGPADQSEGSQYNYRLLDAAGNYVIDFAGTIQSTTTSLTWGVYENLPKIRHQTDGVSVIQWNFIDADKGRRIALDIDLNIADLDADRLESIIVPLDAIAGYSVSQNSILEVASEGAGHVRFVATKEALEPQDASVTLHLRNIKKITLGYESSVNQQSMEGVFNDAAGFRHRFNASVLASYHLIEHHLDTDADGVPDHRDLDSNNDGINDVNSTMAFDVNADGMADGATGKDGIVEFADAIADIPGFAPVEQRSSIAQGDGDSDFDGIIDRHDANPAQFGEGDTDTDGDTLSDHTESAIGTDVNNRDTDGDGVSDGAEVVFYQTDPAESKAQQVNVRAPAPDFTDSDGDGLADSIEGMADFDLDGVPNLYDIDSDNDGIADIVETGRLDANGDGARDTDETPVITDAKDVADFDMDGQANYLDTDSDEDGLSDLIETGHSDADNDGRVDHFVDHNGDGWDDSFFGNSAAMIDSDRDGYVDVLDADPRAEPGVQNDLQSAPQFSTSLRTGVQGSPGCTLTTGIAMQRDYTLPVLLLLALTGLCRARIRDAAGNH